MMAKKVDVRRKKKKNWGKTIGILSIVTIMIAIVTLSALYQRKPHKNKENQLMNISDFQRRKLRQTVEANVSIVVSEVYFNITLVGGDATDVVIAPVQGAVAQEDYP